MVASVTFLIIAFAQSPVIASAGSEDAGALLNSDSSELIGKLHSAKVRGASFGGPYVGVCHIDVTRRIVAKGQAIVPALIGRLESKDLTLDESILVVFCLSELKASEAKSAVQRFKSSLATGNRFPKRDLTLGQMLDDYFSVIGQGSIVDPPRKSMK